MTKLINISRPRFWFYLLGPYLIGVAAGATNASDFAGLDAIIFAIYFTLPANLLVYGINDIFDFETDVLNPKKAGYETLVSPEMRRSLWTWIAILNVPFIVLAVVLAPRALPFMIAFLLTSIFYSAPPIRAKEVPFLDSIFNILYVFPGAFAYHMVAGSFPLPAAIIAAGLWTAAMHAFSAIPDIESDSAAGVQTIATQLGFTLTHFFCMACYAVATLLCISFAPPLTLFGLVYVWLMRWSSTFRDRRSVFGVYRWFPLINVIVGFLIFWFVAWPKLVG